MKNKPILCNRREIRVHCNLTIQFRVSHENSYGTCWNLGQHGMYIAFDGDISPGEHIEISFVMPQEYPLLVEAQGHVVWVNIGKTRKQHELPEGFGVAFTHLTDEANQAIHNFLEQG